MKSANTPLIQGLNSVHNNVKSDIDISCISNFLYVIQNSFLSLSMNANAPETRTNVLKIWHAFLKKEVEDYFDGISKNKREYHEDISFSLKNSSEKIIIREWLRSKECGIEIYTERDEKSHCFLGDITIGYDGFCPFEQNLYEIVQNGNMITVKWSTNPSEKNKTKWRKKTFKVTDAQEVPEIKETSKKIVDLVLSYLNDVPLSKDLKIIKKNCHKEISEQFSHKKDDKKDFSYGKGENDKNTLHEHLFQLCDLFVTRSKEGEFGTEYIIHRCISIILQNYAYPRNPGAVLNYSELFAVYALYQHRLNESKKGTDHSFEESDINVDLFKEVLDMYVSYCSKDRGNFIGKGSIILSDKEYNPREASKMNHLKSTIALFSTYYFLSNPEILKAFCSGADIHFTDSLITSSVDPYSLRANQYNFYQSIYASIQASDYNFRLFPAVVEKMKTNYIRKGPCLEIDKQLEKPNVNYPLIGELIQSIINQSEGVSVPISEGILSAVKKQKAQGEFYVLEVINTLEEEILAACEKNIFCKTFIEKDDVEAIRKYILLNAQLNGNEYTIQNNLVSVYYHISDTLKAHIYSDGWDYQKGDPPTTKDLLRELSSFASYLLKRAMESHDRDAARLWRWEDVPKEMQTNKDTFIALGIIRNSPEEEGTYEFENQSCRLVLAAMGKECDNSQEALKHIDSFLRFYSDIAIEGTKNHLNYHMDDASIYITMFLLSLSEEKRDPLITEMCTVAKSSISPSERVMQEAYIFCLSLLLVQTKYQPTSKNRKNIFELYESNIYHDQILAFNDLKHKDPYYTAYPKFVFSKSLSFDENLKTAPPYYVYLLATTVPELIGERISKKTVRLLNFNAQEIIAKGTHTIFKSFLRLQYLTWTAPSTSKITICKDDLLQLLIEAKKILVNSLESTPSADTMKITYGLQALLMALSNVERAVPGSTQAWDAETKKVLFECLILSEYFQRKHNRFYNAPMSKESKGRLWLQCGGFRYIATLNISTDRSPVALLDEKTSKIVYPVFVEALKFEKDAQNWRFFYMLVRLLGYSNFFQHCEQSGTAIDIPKPDSSWKTDAIFMRYDNMDEWLKQQRYVN